MKINRLKLYVIILSLILILTGGGTIAMAQEFNIHGVKGSAQVNDLRIELTGVSLEESNLGAAINLSFQVADAKKTAEKLYLTVPASPRTGKVQGRYGTIALKRVEGLDQNFYNSPEKIIWWFNFTPANSAAEASRRIKLDEDADMTLGEKVKLGLDFLTLESVSPAMSGRLPAPDEENKDPFLGYFSATLVLGTQRRTLDPGKSEDFGPLRILVQSIDEKANNISFRVSYPGFSIARLLALPDKTAELYKFDSPDFEKFLKKMAQTQKAPFLIRRVYRNMVVLPVSGEEAANTEYYFVKPGKGDKALMVRNERIDELKFGVALPNKEELAFFAGL